MVGIAMVLIHFVQVWVGVVSGLLIVLVIGAGMIGAFYALNEDVFSSTEDIWEGSCIFCT